MPLHRSHPWGIGDVSVKRDLLSNADPETVLWARDADVEELL